LFFLEFMFKPGTSNGSKLIDQTEACFEIV